jgi:2'-5' RNA ligase
VRLFVALELDRALKKALAAAARQAPLLGRNVRTVAEPLLHLTLRFVGDASGDRIAELIDAVEEVAQATQRFAIVVRGTGVFPKPAAARVLWAGIEPSRELTALARSVDEAVRMRGFPPEPRGFSPHITLARVHGAPGRLQGPLDGERPRFGEQEVDEIVVMESQLSPRGPTYVPLSRAPLVEGPEEPRPERTPEEEA